MSELAEKIVVVGAGMGGLAAAARLAHAGCDVTLVEAHEAPGGKMRIVDSPAGPVDAGPTVMTMRHVFDALFEDCGDSLDAHVRLVPETVLARHFWPDGTTLDLYADPEETAAAIREFGGPQAEGEWRRFAARAAHLYAAFEGPMIDAPAPSALGLTRHVLTRPRLIPAMAPLSTLATTLRRTFSDPRLRQLYGRYATYVGGDPFQSPAVLALIAHSEARGVWRVEGGMHRLACAMADLAARAGARLRYGSAVTRIERQSGRIVAAHLSCGTRLPCARIVFNGDPRALNEGLLGEAPRQAIPARGISPRSLSARVWTFAARMHGPELAHHNVFFSADPRDEFGPIRDGRPPMDPTLYICAQDRGTGTEPPRTERFQIIENAAATDTGQPEETETCRTRTTRALARFGLVFSPTPDDPALTTPSDFGRMFPASLGSLYGRSPHGLTAAFDRPTARTKLPGLYLAGGGAHPGAGVPMATLSGRHAAEAILKDLASTSTSRRTATRGGTSTASPRMAPGPSRSSPS